MKRISFTEAQHTRVVGLIKTAMLDRQILAAKLNNAYNTAEFSADLIGYVELNELLVALLRT